MAKAATIISPITTVVSILMAKSLEQTIRVIWLPTALTIISPLIRPATLSPGKKLSLATMFPMEVAVTLTLFRISAWSATINPQTDKLTISSHSETHQRRLSWTKDLSSVIMLAGALTLQSSTIGSPCKSRPRTSAPLFLKKHRLNV